MPEARHVAKGFPGIIAGRKNRLLNKPGLYSGMSFCLQGEFTAPSKKDIAELVEIGGGSVCYNLPALPETEEGVILLERSTKILCPTDLEDDKAQDIYFTCGLHPLAVHYIMECTQQFELLDDTHYRFLEREDNSETTVPMSLAF